MGYKLLYPYYHMVKKHHFFGGILIFTKGVHYFHWFTSLIFRRIPHCHQSVLCVGAICGDLQVN